MQSEAIQKAQHQKCPCVRYTKDKRIIERPARRLEEYEQCSKAKSFT